MLRRVVWCRGLGHVFLTFDPVPRTLKLLGPDLILHPQARHIYVFQSTNFLVCGECVPWTFASMASTGFIS